VKREEGSDVVEDVDVDVVEIVGVVVVVDVEIARRMLGFP